MLNLIKILPVRASSLKLSLKAIFSRWDGNYGIGFKVGSVTEFGPDFTKSMLKIKGLFDYLKLDPYAKNGERSRGFLMGIGAAAQYAESIDVTFIKDNAHSQSENPEFSSIDRILPGVPYGKHFTQEFKEIAIGVLRECGLERSKRPCGIKMHFQRLHARKNHPGYASPNQPHKDNADYVFIAVLKRSHICGGVNTLYNNRKKEVASFELRELEFCLLQDRKFYHHVSEIYPDDESKSGFRDVLTMEVFSI